jgi:two-component system cell cycle response regulator
LAEEKGWEKLADSRKGRILVVDDLVANRELLAQDLEEEGYEVATASSGPQALDKAPSFQPDLILLDIQMPGMNGFETCRKIRLDPELAHCSVVFITAHDVDSEKAREAVISGGDDFLAKPYTPAILLARVSCQVSLARLRKRLDKINAPALLNSSPG